MKDIEKNSELLQRYAIKDILNDGFFGKTYKVTDLEEPSSGLLAKFTK